MKLYKIKVLHGGPKDSHESIETYLIADNDEQVLDWIDINKTGGIWSSYEKYLGAEDFKYYLDDKPVTMKEWVFANKGDIDDENGWDNAYYGIIKWGWELVADSYDIDYAILIKLGIAVKA